MASLFRRKGSDLVHDQVSEVQDPGQVATAPVRRPKAYTPKKGEATRKRGSQAVRRPEPPAADRKEALKRARTRQRQERGEARERMLAGDEKYLLRRDKGPVRRLARDVVDSRHNAATFFFVGLFVSMLGTGQGLPGSIRIASNLLFLVVLAAGIVDTLVILRRIKRLGRERCPKETEGYRGLFFYVAMRTITFRRMRMPRPQVKIGHKI